MAYKSGNPALKNNIFKNVKSAEGSNVMTLNGVALKSLGLLILCLMFASFGWQLASSNVPNLGLLLLCSVIGAFVVALLTIFKKTLAPITAPLYVALEGFVLGIISQMFNATSGGIVIQAILITISIFVAMLFVYLFRLVKVTENFKLGLLATTGGIVLFYFAALILGIFGVSVPLINSSSPWGIAFSVVVVCVAALNLVVDFDFIEQGVQNRAPKYMEWYGSFGLFVTLVWLYLEILRLLAKSRS